MNSVLIILMSAFAMMTTTLAAQQQCRLVPVHGGSVHACASGAGRATIVLAAGAGQASPTWSRMVPELAEASRVITFDRPGFGGSEGGVSPRTPTRIAEEVRTVLHALEVEGPVVLVGHSMGGVHMLRYATLYADDVAAVAILDAPPAGFEEDRLGLLTPAEVLERERLLETGLAGAPEAVRLEREGASVPGEWDFSSFPRSVPLLIVVADSQEFGDLGSESAHRRLWVSKSRQWLDLSERADFLVAEGSGHMIHHDRLDLVVDSVTRLTCATMRDDLRGRSPTTDCF